jgi:TonB-dependent siderophore receptor
MSEFNRQRPIGRYIAATIGLGLSSTAWGQQADQTLEEIVVTGLNFKYNVVETANKMDLAIKDTPQSVKVITEDMLDFSGITKFEDAYKLDAGSHISHAQDGFVRNYFRGFKLDSMNAIKLDGLRMPGIIVPDLAPFERFEIIKGATSTIYGQSPIAGTLNAVSKKPLRDFGGSVSMEAGEHSHYRAEVDVYGPLSDSLSYRAVASRLDEDSFLDHVFNKRTVLAPSLKYDISDDTSITVLTQWQDIEFMPSYGSGVQFLGGDEADPDNYTIPAAGRERFFGLPTGLSERQFSFSRAVLDHRFANDWKLRANGQYSQSDVINKGSYGGIGTPDNFTQLYMYMSDTDSDAYSGEVNLFGPVEAFGREHQLFVGVDYARENYEQVLSYGSIAPDAFNFRNPDYDSLPLYPARIPDYTPDNIPGYSGIYLSRHTLYEEVGATLQAILRASDAWTFLLGTRYSRVELGRVEACCDESSLDPLPSGYGPDDAFTTSKWTFQLGTTYALTENMNIYASYGESFLPRDDRRFDEDDPDLGQTVGPEEGESFEVGLKGEVLRNQVSWSLAAFEIARTNITENDFEHPGFVILRGKQRARGVELDVMGQIAPGWDLYASVASQKNEFVGGEFDGLQSFIAPKFGVSLFSSYEFQNGSLTGLGFGGGIVYKQRGEVRQFDGPAARLEFDHLFDDALEVDLRVFYRRDAWNFQIAATNVFDDEYYSPEDNQFGFAISVNPGRQIIGRVSYEFGKL